MTNRKTTAYRLFGNLKFILSSSWRCGKKLTVLLFFRSPLLVAISLLGLYLSREVVSAVTENQPPQRIVAVIAVISLGTALALIFEKSLDAKQEQLMILLDFRFQTDIMQKCVASDYENMESPAGLTRISKAMESTGSDDRAARQVTAALSSFAANLIGVISYAVLLIDLSPWILLVLTATTLAGFWMLKKTSDWNYRNKDNWKVYDRKLDYLSGNAGDFTKAKDIRLYGMGEWFWDVFGDTLARRMGWHKREQLYGFRADWLRATLSLIRDAAAYGLLVFMLFSKGLTVADFVLYFGVIGGFAGWLNGMVGDFNKLHRFHLGFCELREYLDYPDRANHGDGLPIPGDTFRIEFKNVSYRYAGNDEDTIHTLSFTIEKGEKLAVVGLNGAGKTTLIKLMCGLYTPREGEILADGHPIGEYNREAYFSLFSAVFQDIFLLPLSIGSNISASREADSVRLERALSMAGLTEKIDRLPRGKDTKLIKSVSDDAVELSGGELQKLALARALYKDGKVLVLDEPTAALDPIAESRIYMDYNRMAIGHTSVFISHRLASTRFCDRIILLEKGRIVEEGTHDDLMKKRGKYFELFEVQSHYYKEEAKG